MDLQESRIITLSRTVLSISIKMKSANEKVFLCAWLLIICNETWEIGLSDWQWNKKKNSKQGSESVISLYNNASPPVTNVTRQMFMELGWEVLLYAVYSSNISPSNHYLFCVIKIPCLINSSHNFKINKKFLK